MTDKKFWNDEPVLKEWKEEEDNKEMEALVEFNIEETKNTCYNLPNNMEWYSLDSSKDKDWEDLTNFVREHYVSNNRDWMMFHSKEFLKKALMLPNSISDWMISIKYNGNIIGFIAGTPIKVKILKNDTTATTIKTKEEVKDEDKKDEQEELEKEIVQVDFLCVHKKWRNKRMAPVLVRELTRRIIKKGIFQAVYTSSNEMSLPISKSKFFMKYLDISNLIKNSFLDITDPKKIQELKFRYSTKNVSKLNWQKCEENDIPELKKAFDKFYKNMKIKLIWNDELLKYWFIDQDKVVYSYILKNDKNEIIDFISFFSTFYRKIDSEKLIPVAYIFHHFGESISTENRLSQISYLAKKTGHYLLISWEIVGALREDFISNRFIETSQILNLYIYNWKMKPFHSSQVGLILF